MPELKFRVLGPKKKTVEVLFRKNGDNLTALCSCDTGKEGICQHRINILSGSTDGIISRNPEDVEKVTSWIAGTDVGLALHQVLHATVRMQNVTEDFNAARKQLAKALQD